MRVHPFSLPIGTTLIVLVFCRAGLVASQELDVPNPKYGIMEPALEPYTYAPGDPLAGGSGNDNEEEEDKSENQRKKRYAPDASMSPPPPDWLPPVEDGTTIWRQPSDIQPSVTDPREDVPVSVSYIRRRLTRKKFVGSSNSKRTGGYHGSSWDGLGSTSGLDLYRDEGDREDLYDNEGSKRKKRESGWNGGMNRSMSSISSYPEDNEYPDRRPYERPNSGYQPDGPDMYRRSNYSMQDGPGPRASYEQNRAPDGPGSGVFYEQNRGSDGPGPRLSYEQIRGTDYNQQRGTQNQGPNRGNDRLEPPRGPSRYPNRRPDGYGRSKERGKKNERYENITMLGKPYGGKAEHQKERDEERDDDQRNGNEGPMKGAGSREYHTGGKGPKGGKVNKNEKCKDKKRELEECVLRLLLAHPYQLYDKWYAKSPASARQLHSNLITKTYAAKGAYPSKSAMEDFSDFIGDVCEILIEEKEPNGNKRSSPPERRAGPEDGAYMIPDRADN